MNEFYYHVPKSGLEEEEGKIDFSKRAMIRSIEVVCVPREKLKTTWTYWIGPHGKFLGTIEIKAYMKIRNIRQLYRHIQLPKNTLSN
jgi:hypothetical protein